MKGRAAIPETCLDSALAALCPDLDRADLEKAAAALEAYGRLLRRWAPCVNLVSTSDLDHLWARHLCPALQLRSLVRAVDHQHVVDVGSGAGLPGVPLAVTLPGVHFSLVEGRRRRANFLRHVVRELGLGHVDVVAGRVEDWKPAQPPDLVVSRAVAGPGRLAALTRRCRAAHAFLATTGGPRSAASHGGGAIAWCRRPPGGPTTLLAWP